MSKSSVETYLMCLNSNKTKRDEARVFRYIKRNPICSKDDIIKGLNLTHQTVTARITSLLDSGVIMIPGKSRTICSTLSLFKVTECMEQIRINKENRKKEKYDRWVKSGIKNFSNLISEEVLDFLKTA